MRIIFCIILITFSFMNILSAEENSYYLILKNNKVNVRYGPGFDYPIKFVYNKKNLPVKVIDKKENFRRIIDHKKNNGWIHVSQLRKSKSLITIAQKILFKKPTKYSKPVAKLDEGRLLIVKICKKNWCNIKTNKYSGWVDKNNLWGKIN